MAHPDEVLEYWFADSLVSPEAAAARNAFWFATDPATDGHIWELFADTVTDAAAGHYADWTETARGRLAMIILLDQFPRNMYRGTAEAFRYDPVVMSVAQAGVAIGQLAGLTIPEQAFFLMPYQHSEDIAVQRAGIELMQAMAGEAPSGWRSLAVGYRDYAIKHHDIIDNYGRFPHRNALLGRSSTVEEAQFLANGGESFGQVHQL